MTEITLRVPDNVIRKIRAYNILVAGDSKSFETSLVKMIDDVVSSQIASAVGVTPHQIHSGRAAASGAKALMEVAASVPLFHDEDVSGISSGLGDDAPEEETDGVDAQAEDPYLSSAPSSRGKGGLTDEELSSDMRVSDPKHEAKAEPTFADSMSEDSPEGLFAQVAGLPTPPVDQRVAKRNHAKTVGGRRARVKPMINEENEA